MDTQQVALSDAQGPLLELFTRLSGENGENHLSELKKFLRKPKLLKPVAMVDLPACDRFVAEDEFRTNRDDINLWMSEDFENKFLGKVEMGISTTTICMSKLLQRGWDLTNEDGSNGIIVELGEFKTLFLYHLFTLLIKQARGEEGILLTNEHANIFYISDVRGILVTVTAMYNCSTNIWYISDEPTDKCGYPANTTVVHREV